MDMIRFVLWDYAEADFLAEWQTKHFAQASILSDRKGVLTDKEKKGLLSKLQGTAKPKCTKLGLEQSVQIIEQIEYWLTRRPDDCLYQDIATRLDTLWRTMEHESKTLQFAYIPPDKVRFFEQDKLFGDAVFDAFQESRADVKDARSEERRV